MVRHCLGGNLKRVLSPAITELHLPWDKSIGGIVSHGGPSSQGYYLA